MISTRNGPREEGSLPYKFHWLLTLKPNAGGFCGRKTMIDL